MSTLDLVATDTQPADVKRVHSRSKKLQTRERLSTSCRLSATSSRSQQRKTTRSMKPTLSLSSVAPLLPVQTSAGLTPTPDLSVTGSSSPDQSGQLIGVTQMTLATLVAEIRETHRRRQDFHRAEKSLTLQIKAIGRRLGSEDHSSAETQTGSVDAAALIDDAEDEVQTSQDTQCSDDLVLGIAVSPLVEARQRIKQSRMEVERQLTKLAKRHPVYATFVEPLHGFGALGFAQIIGEAGDLSKYSNPAKLWKRMGLAVINGKSQRRVKGAEAIEQGYSPARRAVMFCIGDSLLKKQNAYKELYDARKQFEREKALADGLIIRAKKKNDPRNDDPPGIRTNLCIHRRAQRYAEKRLLRDLWRVWRDQCTDDTHGGFVFATPTTLPVVT